VAYIKLYEGSFIIVQLIQKKLESQGIVPVIKDEIESARLAGFGVFGSGNQQLFIHESEEREALKIVQKALAGLGL
jgi:hypothetical protein